MIGTLEYLIYDSYYYCYIHLTAQDNLGKPASESCSFLHLCVFYWSKRLWGIWSYGMSCNHSERIVQLMGGGMPSCCTAGTIAC